MVRLEELPEIERNALLGVKCPSFETQPWTPAPPLERCRVAIVSTAGLQRRDAEPFTLGAFDFRVIPEDTPAVELIMSHVSSNFDRTGFQQDVNVVFPIDRLKELAAAGAIGSSASFHYSFMGSTLPSKMEESARHLAGLLRDDGVNAVLLVPV